MGGPMIKNLIIIALIAIIATQTDIGFTDIQKYYNVYCFDTPLFYQSSSNGTDGKLSGYPSQECFTYQRPYWLPSRIY